MAKEGGCLCGNVRISYDGEAVWKFLCHCTDCRKITGSTFSTNIVCPSASLKVLSGTPKTFTKKADSGKEITSYFCGDCGTTLWRTGECVNFNNILKAGVVDDVDFLNEVQPTEELYSHRRAGWITGISSVNQAKSSS